MHPKVILTFGLTVLLFALCEGKVELTMTPMEFKDYITASLTANCSVSSNKTDQRLFTLTLKKSSARSQTEFHSIAWVTGFDGTTHKNHTNATVDGHSTVLSDTGSAHGHLTVTWSHPSFQQAGVYLCEAKFFNVITGETTKENITAKVSDNHARLQDALTKLQTLEDRIISLESDVKTRRSGLDTFNKSVVLQRFTTSHGTYLLSRPFLRNSAFAEATCGLLGGYLAELDQEKFSAVSVELNTYNQTGYHINLAPVLIGITDEIMEGYWRFRTHTQNDVIYLNWVNPTQKNVTGKNCVVLDGNHDWKMDDVPCYDNQPHVHFLCELQASSG